MEERKVGLIPRVVTQGALGPKDYAILLTSKRAIFVLEASSNLAIGSVIGGVIGAVVADSLSPTRTAIDYSNEDIESIAADQKNISVPYSNIRRILVKKGLSGYTLKIEYEVTDKKGKINAIINPPAILIQQKRINGQKTKDTIREYAENVWKAFEKALPPEVAQKIEVEM